MNTLANDMRDYSKSMDKLMLMVGKSRYECIKPVTGSFVVGDTISPTIYNGLTDSIKSHFKWTTI